MTLNRLKTYLEPTDQKHWNTAIENENYPQAATILTQAGFIQEAIDFCLEFACIELAVEIAIKDNRLDMAEKLCRDHHMHSQLANVMVLKGEYETAAKLYAELNQYEKAAKLYFHCEQYAKAAPLYAQIHKYKNAAMCYQKANDIAKLLEMQIKAFERDMILTNGDMMTINVSRTMAIIAAKSYLEDENMLSEGLRVLSLAQALDSTAQELIEQQRYTLAARCYEYAGLIDDARNAYIADNDISNALRICHQSCNDDYEIDTLRRFKKYFKLGQKYISLKNYEDALESFECIPPENPNYLNGLELRGDIHCKLKNYSEAVICFEFMFSLDIPSDRLCRIAYKCGYAYELLGDYENARRLYQKVYDVDPEFHDISTALHHLDEKLRRMSSQHKSVMRSELQFGDSAPKLLSSKPSTPALSPISDLSQRHTYGNSETHSSGISISGSRRIPTIKLGDAEVPAVGSERYKVIEEVARGGMGVVYKAIDTLLMRTVALKVLSHKLRDNAVALEYFMREARASAQLQHINIVTVFDIGCLNDGDIYMAMEYVEGKNLKQLIQQVGPFPTKSLMHVTINACKGLQYAHDHGIIHRDVKSSNIMLTRTDKTIKLLDLGLAKILSEHDKGSTQAIGTPYYMSPEQVLGNEINARSDLYSLGVTLFELSTGVLPFLKGDLPYKHVHETPPRPSEFNPKIHPDIEAIILKLMQKQPEDRFDSCNELINALKHIDYHSLH